MDQIVSRRQGNYFSATTQTEGSSLDMLGEWFLGSWSPSMSIYLIHLNNLIIAPIERFFLYYIIFIYL